jgi:hypothetical protein
MPADEPTAPDHDGALAAIGGRPPEPEHVPPSERRVSFAELMEHSAERQRRTRGEGPYELAEEARRAAEQPDQPAPESPTRLTSDQVLDSLAGPLPEPDPNDPRASALAELERERATWEAVRTGEPVKQQVAAESTYQDALRKVVEENPGIDTEEFAEAAQPHLDRIVDAYGEDFAYMPETLGHLFRELGGSEKYDRSLTAEEASWASALRGEGRRTDDGRVEIVGRRDVRSRAFHRYGL